MNESILVMAVGAVGGKGDLYCCNKADTINKEEINKRQRAGREGQTLGLYRHAHVSLKDRVKSTKINLSEEESAGWPALARTQPT